MSDNLKAEIASLVKQHGAEGSAFRPALLEMLKQHIKRTRNEAEAQLLERKKGTKCAMFLSDVQDEIVCALHDLAIDEIYPATNPSTAEHLAVVAVGGYGRAALAPGSDIDLLFLLPYKQTAWGESVVEFLLYMLWDLGFKVGHATRSIDECIRLAASDETILTSVLEARLLCGDANLFDELQERFIKDIIKGGERKFTKAKLAERDQRHIRSGESRYLVEPDVKDGKGGLRDLHTLFWIGKFIYGARQSSDLVGAGVFNENELARFTECEDFLWTVRCHLHFITGRGDDRLSFDKQSEIAKRLGFEGEGRLKPVETFMRQYFLIAKDVGDLTRIFCSVLEASHVKKAPKMSSLFKGFRGRGAVKDFQDLRIDNGRLNFVEGFDPKKSPASLLFLFKVAVRSNFSIHPDAYTTIRRSLDDIDDNLRNDPKANASFIKMLTESGDPEGILKRMNQSGLLARFIPEFDQIVAMMQFNMYHHYTVDEHLLRAVGNLAQIDKGLLEEEHPLSSELFKTLNKSSRKVLYLAVFLHDIAKGREESHSIAGERVARQLCPRLGLNPSETDSVAWLVRNHLVMSETAQSRDLNDFKTIMDFAAIVQSPERLKLLLILTVCDIRAVGPGVWNGWKGQLLRTLYYEAEPVLSGGHSSISRKQRIETAHQAFLQATDLEEKPAREYIARHYDPYWLTTDTQHQIDHARLMQKASGSNDPISTSVRTDEFTAITELTILAPDHPRLLSLLTGACAAGGGNIAGAQIFTTTDGQALDTLLIQRENDDRDEHKKAARIVTMIDDILHGRKRLRDVLEQKRRPDIKREAFSVEPRVIVDNDSSNIHTVIELVGLDRLGLLHDLTEELYNLNLNIASAHITTYGERAVDVFYVSDLTGAKITNANRRSAIIRHLTKALAGDAKAGDDK